MKRYILCIIPIVMLLSGCIAGTGLESALYSGTSYLTGASSADRSTRLRDKESIKQAQTALRKLGYRQVGTIDGKWGPKTKRAIRAFQNDKLLRSDGYVTAGLLEELKKECRSKGILLTKSKRGRRSGHSPLSDWLSMFSQEGKDRKSRVDREGNQLVAGIGGAGAVLGGVIGHGSGIGAPAGALVGAGVGALTASVINHETKKRHKKYTRSYNEIEKRIKTANNRLASLKKKLKKMSTALSARKQKMEELQVRAERGEDLHAEAEVILTELEDELRRNKKLSEKTRKNIRVLRKEVQDIEKDMKDDPGNGSLKKKRDKLAKCRDRMVVSLEKINAITPKLEHQKENIASLLSSPATHG